MIDTVAAYETMLPSLITAATLPGDRKDTCLASCQKVLS